MKVCKESPPSCPRQTATKEIFRAVAEKWCKDNGFDLGCADSLAEAIEFEGKFGDGYKIAKRLDTNHLWDVDAELVSNLDGIWMFVDHMVEDNIKTWVRYFKLEPAFSIGDEVHIGKVTGTVHKIRDDGTALVSTESLKNGWLVEKWENISI